MSVFKTKCWFFLRNPWGGVEDVDRMQAAGFDGVFCNIGDFIPIEWTTIRDRCLNRGMFCGPWARTQQHDGTFSEVVLNAIIQCAENWQSPLIVNSEAELKGTGEQWTTRIAQAVKGLDAGVSVEPQPFADVAWWPLKDVPVLPQMMAQNIPSFDWLVDQWHAYGVDCVFPTYSSWGGQQPSDFPLNGPYGLYTADDCGGNYAAWSPTSYTYQGCIDSGGGDPTVTPIGPDHGIRAMFNRLRDMDPGGTLLVKGADGKWPPISTLEDIPVKNWKAYDKAERANTILVTDHDESLA